MSGDDDGDWDGWGDGWAAEDEEEALLEGGMLLDDPFADPRPEPPTEPALVAPVGAADGGAPPPERPRRGREWLIAVLVVLVIGGIIGGVVATRGDDDDGGRASTDLETDRSTTSLSSTTSSSVLGLPGDPGTTTSSTTAADGSSSTVTTAKGGPGATVTTKPSTATTEPEDDGVLPCMTKKGTDGPTAPGWLPAGTNKGMTVTLCFDDPTPKVGQTVTITVHANDPDAFITNDDCGGHLGIDSNYARDCRVTVDTAQRQTPPRSEGDVLFTFPYKFTSAGDHSVGASSTSGGREGYVNPYASFANIVRTITVHP